MAKFKITLNDGSIVEDGEKYVRERKARQMGLDEINEITDDILHVDLRLMKKNGAIKEYEIIGRIQPVVCIIE